MTQRRAAGDGPAAPQLKAVAFADVLHGWAVGRGGTVVATTDGGATWERQHAGTRQRLDAVATAGPRYAWVLARHAILATTDGGATWREQRTPAVDSYRDIAFVDPAHGWAVGVAPGPAGVILATTDGGRHWRVQRRIATVELLDIAALDTRRCWVAGSLQLMGDSTPTGILVATADGGEHWAVQLRTTAALADVTFTDVKHGWAVGAPGRIVKGSTTVSTTTTSSGEETSVSGQPIYSDMVYATRDGGATWSLQYTDYGGTDISRVAFSDARHGWVAGADVPLLTTSDGGATWITPGVFWGDVVDIAVCDVRRP